MAPSVASEPLSQEAILDVKNAPFAYRANTWKPLVEDDFMYDFKYNFPLPTHGVGAEIFDFTVDDEKNKQAIAEGFLKELEQIIQARDSQAFAGLFLDSGKFHLILLLLWQYRC